MTDFETMQPLSRQIGAAHDMLQHILRDPSNEIDGILWGALDGVQIILREARDYADEQLSDARKAKDAFKEMCEESKPDSPVKIDRVDLCRTINEALSMADHSIDLIQCVRADLAGKPRPPLGQEPGEAS